MKSFLNKRGCKREGTLFCHVTAIYQSNQRINLTFRHKHAHESHARWLNGVFNAHIIYL